MNEDDLLKQLKSEEKLYAAEISKALTMELNSRKTQAEAAEMSQSSAQWPLEPTRQNLQFYDDVVNRAWGRMASGYKHLDVEMEVNAAARKPPTVKATVSYKGDFQGGMSYELKPGDTIVSVAKKTYGHESYAGVIWEANEDILGPRCRVIPAGFGIRLPRIWVADWKKSPSSAGQPAGVSVRATKLNYPTIEYSVESKAERTVDIDCGSFILSIKLEVEAKLTAQKKGTIDATFDLKEYKTSVSKNVGPLEGGYSFSLKEGKGTADIAISNANIPGLKFTTKISIKDGGLKITFGSKKVSFTVKDMTFEGSVKLSATGKIKPKPSASAPVTAPRPVNWNMVAAVVVVGAIVVVGILLIPESGGTSLIAAEKAGTMAAAALLASQTVPAL